jgi:TPR repeat protein
MSLRRKLLKSARTGDATSQFDLACEYDFTPPKRKERAIYWYLKAAEQGHPTAQNYLGESYRDGWSVKRNQRKAIYWLRRAAANGETDAQLSLGVAYFYGNGVKKNRAKALALYRKAARNGDESAAYNIGHMYRCGNVVAKNLRLAIRWYLRAATKGHVGAMHWLGRIYGGMEKYPEDRAKAFYWLKHAAEQDDAQSQCFLGVCYVNGSGVERDPVTGAAWYRRAAQQSDEWAFYLLGLCYRDGTGVRRNCRLARYWFQKAATQKGQRSRARFERARTTQAGAAAVFHGRQLDKLRPVFPAPGDTGTGILPDIAHSRPGRYVRRDMDLNTIRNALQKHPFRPFDLCLADGRRIPVKHPEFVAMNNRVVIVVDEESYTQTIEPLLIVSVEQMAEPARGNGKHKKKPKS